MNRDLFNRKIDYLRIAVTSACNFRCTFCSPQNYDCTPAGEDELSDQEIIKIVIAAAKIGFTKIRLTGGEPLLRPNLIQLVGEISKIAGIKEVTITTNGSMLEKYAKGLYNSGIKRININIPTLDNKKYIKITGTGTLKNVVSGIKAARKIGMGIKINVVATSDLTESEVVGFSDFAKGQGLQLRFIEYMPLNINPMTQPLSMQILRIWLERNKIKAGVIAVMEKPFCHTCNRLRISSSGEVYPCLFGAPTHCLDPILKDKTDNIGNVLLEAIRLKPASYHNANFEEIHRPMIRTVGG